MEIHKDFITGYWTMSHTEELGREVTKFLKTDENDFTQYIRFQ